MERQNLSDQKVTRISHPYKKMTKITPSVDLTRLVLFAYLEEIRRGSNYKERPVRKQLILVSKQLQV